MSPAMPAINVTSTWLMLPTIVSATERSLLPSCIYTMRPVYSPIPLGRNKERDNPDNTARNARNKFSFSTGLTSICHFFASMPQLAIMSANKKTKGQVFFDENAYFIKSFVCSSVACPFIFS